MNEDLQKVYNFAVDLIGHKAVVSDEELNAAIAKLSVLFPDIDKNALKTELLANYSTTVEAHQILDGKDRRKPWLKQFRADKKSTWDFWNRYVEYLRKDKGFPDASINQIDNLTEDVVDRLFDPNIKNIVIDKKGLVVGQVQSGKNSKLYRTDLQGC